MDNPNKPATHHYTQTTKTRHEPFHKQLQAKTNKTSFPCGNRSGDHNTEHRTQRIVFTEKKVTLFVLL